MAPKPKPIQGRLPRFWDSAWTETVLLLLGYLAVLQYWTHIPAPGKAIGIAALVAGVMAVRELNRLTKFLWIVILAGLLTVEFRAINDDRRANEDAHKSELQTERESFAAVLQAQSDSFRAVLAQDAEHYAETIREIANSIRGSEQGFSRAIERTERLNSAEERRFAALSSHEEELAQALGGVLLPGSEPTPANICVPPKELPVALEVFIGLHLNVAIISNFPKVILRSASHGDVITIDRSAAGVVTLKFDLRDADGQVIARMNKAGYVVNRNKVLDVKRDSSGVLVDDLYGQEVLNVRFLNPKAIWIRGTGIEIGGMTRSCVGGVGSGPLIVIP